MPHLLLFLLLLFLSPTVFPPYIIRRPYFVLIDLIQQMNIPAKHLVQPLGKTDFCLMVVLVEGFIVYNRSLSRYGGVQILPRHVYRR